MSYNYQDAPRESQQEYFGKVHTDNKETLYNALKRIEELEKENAELKAENELIKNSDSLCKLIGEQKLQIEQMKSDVRTNIKWADQKKNNQMYCKLNTMLNQWEIKENGM